MAAKKPEAFTEKENVLLRAVLKKWRDKVKLSQTKAGEVLGIGQQAVGALENGGGFSRPTAAALARTQGFESAEALLEAYGMLAEAKNTNMPWKERDLAFGMARRLGYEERVLDRVAVRYADTMYQSRSPKWWMERIVQMAQEFEAERAEAPEPPASTGKIAVAEKTKRRRKGAA